MGDHREVIFCVNSSRGGETSSGFAYYKDISTVDGSRQPDDYVDVVHDTLNDWEGRTTSKKFPDTGVTFTITIQANAAQQVHNVSVGTGNNGFRNFNVLVDDKRQIYNVDGWSVTTIYYCV